MGLGERGIMWLMIFSYQQMELSKKSSVSYLTDSSRYLPCASVPHLEWGSAQDCCHD